MRGFLVRGVCECGWECGCPEGAIWPHCPMCGKQVLPPKPQYPGDPAGRTAYSVLPEQEALKESKAI